MVPVSFCTNFNEVFFKEGSHVSHSLNNWLKLLYPFLSHIWIIKQHSCNSCSMDWRWRIIKPNYCFTLRLNSRCDFFTSTNNVHCSNSFTIKTHYFCKRLSNYHFKTWVKEVAQTLTIFVNIPRDESLVGCVKEWEKTVFSHYLSNFFPLIESRINSCWVVSASMQKNYRPWSCSFEIKNHTFKIKCFGLRIKISVLSYF